MPSAELSLFHFVEYRLSRFLFSGSHPDVDDESLAYEIGIETSATCPQKSADSQDSRITIVSLKIWIDWKPSPGPFILEIEGDGIFASSPNMPADQYRDLCEIHAPALIYTQFRPLTRIVSSEGGHRFMLPLINIGETIKRARSQGTISLPSASAE
jgi:preprotein translocase subunit SecB